MSDRGKRAEDYAAAVLERAGWHIEARNFHTRYGELDLVAVKDGVLAFVEVKARSGRFLRTPGEAVTKAKRQKLIMTALFYLQEHRHEELQPRFDVFEVIIARDGGFEALSHDIIEGAFDLSETDWYH